MSDVLKLAGHTPKLNVDDLVADEDQQLCGNPKRYTSADVVQMQKHEKKSHHSLHASASTSENRSESDQYITTLVKRQIDTDVTLDQHFSKHRRFTESSSHAPSVTNLQGLHSIHDHVRLDEYDSTIEYLKSCGLTNKEIAFKLKKISTSTDNDTKGFGADPASEEQLVADIERKLADKEAALGKPDKFNGGLELSRQALALEKAILERQNKESDLPQFLFKEKQIEPCHPDDPINDIPSILSDIEPKPCRDDRRDRRKKRKLNQKLLRQQNYYGVNKDPKAHKQFMESVGLIPESWEGHIDSDGDKDLSDHADDGGSSHHSKKSGESIDRSVCVSNELITPNVCVDNATNNQKSSADGASKRKKKKKCVAHGAGAFTVKDFTCDITLIGDEEIRENRLSLDEILSMDKFKHYEQGNPTNTVFVKNLASSVTDVDLISLFGRFDHLQTANQTNPEEEDNTPPVSYRLLTGRMKGQAFVTFPDVETATRSITNLNGYKLHRRPVILSFGKKLNDS